MKKYIILLFLLISMSTYTQRIIQQDTITLEHSFIGDLSQLGYSYRINYWEYMSDKPYYHYDFSLRSLNPSISFGFKNKKLYICDNNYFYYRQYGKKYKFTF